MWSNREWIDNANRSRPTGLFEKPSRIFPFYTHGDRRTVSPGHFRDYTGLVTRNAGIKNKYRAAAMKNSYPRRRWRVIFEPRLSRKRAYPQLYWLCYAQCLAFISPYQSIDIHECWNTQRLCRNVAFVWPFVVTDIRIFTSNYFGKFTGSVKKIYIFEELGIIWESLGWFNLGN